MTYIVSSGALNSTHSLTHVRLLGVTIAADLGLDMHLANVCKTCVFWLCQVRHIRRSIDVEAVKILVLSFVISRVDYSNSILVSVPEKVT